MFSLWNPRSPAAPSSELVATVSSPASSTSTSTLSTTNASLSDAEAQAMEILKEPTINASLFTLANFTGAGSIAAAGLDIAKTVTDPGSDGAASDPAAILAPIQSLIAAVSEAKEYHDVVRRYQAAQIALIKLAVKFALSCSYEEDGKKIEVAPPYNAKMLQELFESKGNLHIQLNVPDANVNLHQRNLVSKTSVTTFVLSLAPAATYATAQAARAMGHNLGVEGRVTLAALSALPPGKLFRAVLDACRIEDKELMRQYARVLQMYVDAHQMHTLREEEIAPFAAFLSDEDARKLRSARDAAVQIALKDAEDPEAQETTGLVAGAAKLKIRG